MVNKCAAYGCKVGYVVGKTSKSETTSTFSFPLKNPELLQKWISFVNRVGWTPTSHSVLCINHFEEKYLFRGNKRNKLNWKMNPYPTIHTEEARKRLSLLPSPPPVPRKAPTIRTNDSDEYQQFKEKDNIKDFSDLCSREDLLPEFQYKQFDNYIIFYKLIFNSSGFPCIKECIKVDFNLHVQLQYNGISVPLPKWFVIGHNAKLSRVSMLENFPAYIRERDNESPYSILDELYQRQYYKLKGRPPYTPEVIRFSLMLRYTSRQAYSMLLEKFPLPSMSLLQKIQQGGVDSMKAAKLLREKGELSSDVILMADEMYLEKGTQFHSGKYIGSDKDGELYKGIVAFMITGLKKSVPCVVKASPERAITGEWLKNEIVKSVTDLINAGFDVRGIVTDNHSANVSAFEKLLKEYGIPDEKRYIEFEKSKKKTFLFFDTVHLLKNIRNNLLNRKKFVFPEFEFNIEGVIISSGPGYISWSDFHTIYEIDQKLTGNLRKAPKLSLKALFPGNNKQNVDLVLSIFHETTIAASRSYLPERKDISSFLDLILTWWLQYLDNTFPEPYHNALSKYTQKI